MEIYPAAPVHRRAPGCVNYRPELMLAHVAPRLPAAGVAILPDTRVVSPDGWLIGPGDCFLTDHSWYRTAPEHCPVTWALRLAPDRRFPGTTLTLVSDFAFENYAHLLLDALPRMHLVERAGFTWDRIDRVIVPDLSSPGRRRLAEIARIPEEKMVAVSSFRVAECATLIAPNFPGVRRNTPPWVTEFWKAKLERPIQSPVAGKRLYLSRNGWSRAVRNEQDLRPALEEFGFQIVQSGTHSLAGHVQEAEMIAGGHGAALADVAFCSPGSTLIEVTPSRHIVPFFYTLASSAGMDYFSVLAESDEKDPNPRRADMQVDPAVFRSALALASSRAGSQP